MMRAYSELYLSDAKSTLAEFFDYGAEDCEMDADMLAQIFAFSEYGKGFERGNPGIIGGMSGTELFVKVMEKADPDFKPAARNACKGKSPAYWAGWALAQYQWESSRRFKDIFSKVPFSQILSMYGVYHKMDIKSFTAEMELRCSRDPETRLKKIRQNRGISQAELSKNSGVNLRSIQMYEQRVNDIDKAQAKTLYRLSRSLGCDIEDLLENPAR